MEDKSPGMAADRFHTWVLAAVVLVAVHGDSGEAAGGTEGTSAEGAVALVGADVWHVDAGFVGFAEAVVVTDAVASNFIGVL